MAIDLLPVIVRWFLGGGGGRLLGGASSIPVICWFGGPARWFDVGAASWFSLSIPFPPVTTQYHTCLQVTDIESFGF